jgi:hypothetical protein
MWLTGTLRALSEGARPAWGSGACCGPYTSNALRPRAVCPDRPMDFSCPVAQCCGQGHPGGIATATVLRKEPERGHDARGNAAPQLFPTFSEVYVAGLKAPHNAITAERRPAGGGVRRLAAAAGTCARSVMPVNDLLLRWARHPGAETRSPQHRPHTPS